MAKEKDTKPMANTVIGSGLVIDGEITGEEALTIQGTVKGKIMVTQAVTVEIGATVEADVEAQTVTVSGKLTGNVVARERIELKPDGKMIGDAKSPRIVIADGAGFKGNVDMDV
jgi:cytoskeletal protein CcmA (bactofilin family)